MSSPRPDTPVQRGRGTWLPTTSSGDKGTPRQAHQLLFSGVAVWTPLYLSQGKAKNISYGCGPCKHLTCPFNMVPSTEMNKLVMREGWEEMPNRCGGCPAPIVSLHHKLGDTIGTPFYVTLSLTVTPKDSHSFWKFLLDILESNS